MTVVLNGIRAWRNEMDLSPNFPVLPYMKPIKCLLFVWHTCFVELDGTIKCSLTLKWYLCLCGNIHGCCCWKISYYVFNCGHLADSLLLLRYSWLLLLMWPQDKANNYQHPKQLVVLYYIEVNYTGIRVDYFYQMGDKLLINSLL